jgi:hypothetical protein
MTHTEQEGEKSLLRWNLILADREAIIASLKVRHSLVFKVRHSLLRHLFA